MVAGRKLSLVALVGATLLVPFLLLGARSNGEAAGPSGKMGTYTEILALIESRYVPEADPKKLVYASIDGMLDTLDPHTNFLDDDNYREMREEQRGVFYGLGIVISKRGRYQPLRVVAPIADTPADRMGIRGGDTIAHIRDTRANIDTDTIDLTIQEAVKFLRGPRGSEVEVTIDRDGLTEPLIFKILRDEVRTPAVNQAFMIRPGIGYVHVANFTETTSSELDQALEKLQKAGAQRLILDLSGNPGGLLDQAIGVSSRFLPAGELVVYTEGRNPGSRQDFASMRDVPHFDWPVVAIVDRESASASEIVSGALQDHDRGIIVGETTFGKGLVQSVYPLSESTALALTTQKYYTPVGRSIQRPFSHSEEDEYFLASRGREAVPKPREDSPVYRTETGRTVYGGGGVTPDIPVPFAELSETMVQLQRQTAFSRFVSPLKKDKALGYAGRESQLFDDFLAWSAKEVVNVPAGDVLKVRDDVQLQLKAELALTTGGVSARERVLLDRNPTVLKALEAFPEAERLLAKKREWERLQKESPRQAAQATPPR